MFHASTTLHHRRNFFPASGRENRLVGINWFAEKRLQAAVVWDYLRGPRKLARLYSWGFGWPLIEKGFDYTVKGMDAAVDGAYWLGQTATEVGKGALQMTASPLLMLAKSRLTMIKRMLWDVPIATFSAAIRTPIALARSPLEMIRGVRDAIVSVPKNIGEIYNSVTELKLGETLNNTRKAITDVLFPPITRPLKPILAPAGHLIGTAAGAELQTVGVLGQIVTHTIPEGGQRIWHAGETASGRLAERRQHIEEAKAVLEKEKAEKEAALQAHIKSSRGEGGEGGGGGGGKKK